MVDKFVPDQGGSFPDEIYAEGRQPTEIELPDGMSITTANHILRLYAAGDLVYGPLEPQRTQIDNIDL